MNQQHRALKKLSVEIIASRTLGRICACNMGVEEGDLCEISKYLEMLLSSQERTVMLLACNSLVDDWIPVNDRMPENKLPNVPQDVNDEVKSLIKLFSRDELEVK